MRSARILGYFEKKAVGLDLRLDEESWDSNLAWPVQLFAAGCARVCWISELRAYAGRTVRIVKIVSLSPRVKNLKVKKVIKVSYLNQESRQCFGIPMHVNGLTHPYIRNNVLFTYRYFGRMLQVDMS